MPLVERTKSIITSRIAKEFPKGNSDVHWHNNCEICTLLTKPCSFLVDGDLIKANVGDIVVIDESVVHQFIVENSGTDIRIAHLRLSCFTNLEMPIKSIKTHITRGEIEAIPGLADQIDMLSNMMDNELRIAEDVKENPVLFSLAASLYFLLMRHFPKNAKKRVTKTGSKEFYEILDFINNNYKEDITTTSIAEALFMSRKKVASVFLKFSATQINEYINMRRIKNVNRLLNEGRPVTEAAIESGFQSLRTFNYAYKKVMGITPTQYLKNRPE